MTSAGTQRAAGPLRVLHLDSGREMRGGQWQALALHQELRQRGVESLLLVRAGSALESAARQRDLPALPLRWSEIVRRRDWLVHAHDATSHTLAAVAGARRLVVARRVVFPVKGGVLSRWKYGRAQAYLAVSEGVLQVLLLAGVPVERIHVVYDGVDPLPTPIERRDVVALESDDPGKCNALIREAANRGGFEVRFSRDLPAAFRHAKLFVYLSSAEGLGSAALLAMSAGIPVVASRIPGLSEVVEHGKTGLLVDNEAAAVAAAVSRLLGDEALCQTLGDGGRLAVENRFRIEQMVENTLAVYHSL